MNNQILDSKAIGQRIQTLRIGLGLSRGEFAKQVEAHSSNSVRQWECGRSVPSLETAIRICNRFDVSINELILGFSSRETH